MEKNNNMQKITETLGDAMKLAANLSEATKNTKPVVPDNSNNSNPNQTVQIQIADPGKHEKEKEPPKVIHQKPVTHIHKDFPDSRALTDKECELALQKAKMANELEQQRMQYRQYQDELDRRERKEREEYERKQAEERRIRNEKKARIRGIIGACLAALGVGVVGYSVYTDNRDRRRMACAGGPNGQSTIKVEGTVE